jgi:hypothetical protein
LNLVAGHHDFSISSISNNLREFVYFTNNFIQADQMNLLFYYLVPPAQTLETAKEVLIKGNKFRLHTYRMVEQELVNNTIDPDRQFIGFDPLKAGIEIRFEKSGEMGTMMPFGNGRVDPKSMVTSGKVKELISDGNGKDLK